MLRQSGSVRFRDAVLRNRIPGRAAPAAGDAPWHAETRAARPRDITRLVVGQGMTTVAVGLAAGLVAAVGLVRFVAGLLYGVEPHDPVSFIAATATVALVALAACWLPARRAGRVDPLAVIRGA